MIKLHQTKADFSDMNIANLYQIPNTTFGNFWNGSDTDYMEYMQNFRLNYNWDVNNIEQLHKVVSDCFNGFIKATGKSIGQFNFLLRAAMKHRNLPSLENDDYMKLEIDLSGEPQEVKQEIKNRFYQMSSRSFIDFRSEEKDKLVYVYNRRGMMNEGERIAICKAKPSITLTDNFKSAKDNNFIISGVLKDIALPNTEFSFTYTAGNDTKELKASAEEILQIATAKSKEAKNIIKPENEVKIADFAKKEIKQENTQTRQSLKAESTYEEITKEATSSVKIDYNNIESTLQDYEAKELEKLKQRMAYGKEVAMGIYKELRTKIDSGIGILEALNVLKQKYREEHAVNMASVYLSRDLQEIAIKEQTIANLLKAVNERDETIAQKDIEITKREDSLYNAKSTIAQKENDLRLLKEKMEETIENLEAQTKATIQEIEETHTKEKEELEKEILVSDELISKQENEISALNKTNEILQKENNDLKNENKTLIKRESELEAQNQALQKREKMLETIEQSNKELIIDKKSLQSENALMSKRIDELEAMLKDFKTKNAELSQNLATLQKDYHEVVKTLTTPATRNIAQTNSKVTPNEKDSQEKKSTFTEIRKSRVSEILPPKKKL
ncbi:hypothetical protein [Helicobacter sp. T3_23-1059]